MKWLESFKSQYSKDVHSSSATSTSLVAFIIAFALSFGYLYFQQPEWVKYSENFQEPVFSYRLTIVYSLLAASTIALIVFGYQYWALKHRKPKENESKLSNDSNHSKGSKGSRKSQSARRR